MEFLLELLFDFILEGSMALASEKTIPMPLRILAGLVVFVIFFGLGGVFTYMGYESVVGQNKVAGICLFVVGAIMILGGMFLAYKMLQKKKEGKH